ncbi:MAG TPA: type II toxin-antitoxin system VapB family antitoxin [Candidatus Angelobacter sp.]|nr:type II toxin-antitoxin system VapB family antitoxin [Candidatus Angelobacter sp.]
MPIHIKNSEAERLVRELSHSTGETLTQTIINALKERLERLKGRRQARSAEDKLRSILQRVDQLHDIDGRSAGEILGYDRHGVPE